MTVGLPKSMDPLKSYYGSQTIKGLSVLRTVDMLMYGTQATANSIQLDNSLEKTSNQLSRESAERKSGLPIAKI